MAEPQRKSSKKTVHWHGCRRCPTAYEDNCPDAKTDALCTACRGGKPWMLLIENRKPRPCCRELSRLATKAERDTYRLAGARVWWICRACARTQPFDPKKETP
jgi:hypothetical protein